MRQELCFLRNGKPVRLHSVDPTETLLDYLRLSEKSCGTKEGCNEGDCGACTVAVGRVGADGELTYAPVNACIQLMGMIDGCDLITVDDLHSGDTLHPVQKAMADLHGSQCGFCTPGFVMSLFCLYHEKRSQQLSRGAVNEWLAGNLCRCTGYRPIADAAFESCGSPPEDSLSDRIAQTRLELDALSKSQDYFLGDRDCFFAAPSSADAVAALYTEHPDAQILAGATDVGLWITKQLRHLPKIISIMRAGDLAEINEDDHQIILPAGVTYRQSAASIAKIDPDMAELWSRIGSKQVRASGTVCGNIANGSPIGDTPPALIALGATLTLMSASGKRSLALEDFFLDYGKQDRSKGEFVHSVAIPRLSEGEAFRAFKVSKRFDQDISAVMMGVKIRLKNGLVESARIAFGGMAATPKRAKRVEEALIGDTLTDEERLLRSVDLLEEDFSPISDMRASQDYRRRVAKNILFKALLEIGGSEKDPMRLISRRTETADVA